MELNCEGCAGCCLDWRPLSDAADGEAIDHERRGPREPLDDTYDLVPLSRDEVRAFLDAGLGDAMTPRLWAAADGDDARTVDGHELAAIGGRPAFFVGLRKPPKPVAPFGRERASWLPTCAFLDPESLQCRIHGGELYPRECADYPGHNLALDVETECERVEANFGGDRLLAGDGAAFGDLRLGPGAVGWKLFVHPDPERIEGAVGRIAEGTPTAADRAEFVAVAAASSPGTVAISEPHYGRTRSRALATDSWVGQAIPDWKARRDRDDRAEPALADRIEGARGAPPTPGWGAPDGPPSDEEGTDDGSAN